MSGLSVSILESPTGATLLDPTSTLTGLRFGTNKHGFASLSCFVPRTLYDAFYLYDRPGLPHVVVAWNGYTAWEGRLEDVAVTGAGVRLGALGYWRALSDYPYTALYSASDAKLFRVITENDISSRTPAKYEFNNDNRLYISLKKNEIYANNADAGTFGLQIPDDSTRAIAYITFAYDYTLPTNWKLQTDVLDAGFSGSAAEDTITGDGANHTGTKTITVASANKEIIAFSVYNATGGNYTNTGESDDWFIKLTAIRITTVDANVYPEDIVNGIISATNTVNSTQLQNITALVNAPGIDLFNEIYEDRLPSDILDYLAGLGDSAGYLYECGVWENRTLHFRRRGSQGRAWYVDVSDINIERTMETLHNYYYATYQEASSNQTLRTAVNSDSFSIARYGLTRRAMVNANTTDATQAGYVRDTALVDGKSPRPRAGLAFDRLYDASGGLYPNFMMRSGDTVTIRNLPPTLSTDIDRIRTFTVAETEYDCGSNVITPTPEYPLPTLDFFLARQAAGVA